MLLTITTTHQPATDLGFLLHKHPGKLQTVKLANGEAHIFYPEATEEKCTAALLMEIDSIGLVRNNKGPSGEGFALEQYVNDRPYVASSFMSTAIAEAYSSALNGTCHKRPELVDTIMPLEAKLSVVSARGGEPIIRGLFKPLGYEIMLEQYPLDPAFPEWGDSRYFTLVLKKETTLKELLSHLFVLIPVMDNDKHYFVSRDEVEKLFKKGKGWLEIHPLKELITKRYLKNLGSLTRYALDILLKEENEEEQENENEAEVPEEKIRLHELRLQTVKDELIALGAKRIVDMGCGEGKLMRLLIKEKQVEYLLGMDVSIRSLEIAKDRLNLDKLPPRQQERIGLMQGSLTYRDKRLSGFDAAALVEVIEHLDLSRLRSLERVVFEYAKPKAVIITTPNAEYNKKYEKLSAGTFRHSDHRFEWTRAEFESWANKLAETFQYEVSFKPLGPEDAELGAPSQMGIFKKIIKS
jgi:3' terminal RNA ribose 2'-O-methyltransferase Hen1